MIEIDERELDALLADDPGGPVVMLNLLRFRPDGGRESYQRYAEALGQSINARYGLSLEYLGDGGRALGAAVGLASNPADEHERCSCVASRAGRTGARPARHR